MLANLYRRERAYLISFVKYNKLNLSIIASHGKFISGLQNKFSALQAIYFLKR
jgi:hypothetical protein